MGYNYFEIIAGEFEMTDIHFIETSGEYKKLGDSARIWSSGTWDVSLKKANSLIGGRIFLHTSQKGPSFLCGEIIDVEEATTGRVTFIFRHDRSLVNTLVGENDGNWGQEQITVNR